MKAVLITTLILGAVLTSSINSANSNPETLTKNNKKAMQNFISIIEIPTSDLKRAINFYETILTISIEEVDMGEVKMGVFPSEAGTMSVVLANGADYKPTNDGSVLYLNGGENLQTMLDKVEPNGGKILVPKTEISPEMGFFALFTDTEGNKMGLHSAK